MTDPEVGVVQVRVRRRRTRRHRRNRLIRRILLVATLGIFSFVFASFALRVLTPSLFRSQVGVEPARRAEAENKALAAATEDVYAQRAQRPRYPYSVIEGGVEDARELKWVAEHDPVVAFHYRGFDFANARVVRLALDQNVYVSYRIGNNVYWTHHPIKLKKGEKVITDGKITARTRCGNRVEEIPQQATSSSEPPAAKFEEPVHDAQLSAMKTPPVPFQSALLNRPMPNVDPLPASSLYNPFVGGNWTPISAPPIPAGLCGGTKRKNKDEPGAIAVNVVDAGSTGKKKKNVGPCGESSGVVPEPGTWVLMASGLALVVWQVRRRGMLAV